MSAGPDRADAPGFRLPGGSGALAVTGLIAFTGAARCCRP